MASAFTSSSANATWWNCGFLDTSLRNGRMRLHAALHDYSTAHSSADGCVYVTFQHPQERRLKVAWKL